MQSRARTPTRITNRLRTGAFHGDRENLCTPHGIHEGGHGFQVRTHGIHEGTHGIHEVPEQTVPVFSPIGALRCRDRLNRCHSGGRLEVSEPGVPNADGKAHAMGFYSPLLRLHLRPFAANSVYELKKKHVWKNCLRSLDYDEQPKHRYAGADRC